jgi:hypothetical protein
MVTKSMSEFLVNPKKYADNKGDFENGSRIDENGEVITENDFVTLKEKVKELNKNKEANKEEVIKINAAPRVYLESLPQPPQTNTDNVNPLKDVESTEQALNVLDKKVIQENLPLTFGEVNGKLVFNYDNYNSFLFPVHFYPVINYGIHRFLLPVWQL